MSQDVHTLIIGAGHAGLALSRSLTMAGHDHVVLERDRIGERWRTERWSSMRLLTPNRLNALPGSAPHDDPDGHLEAHAFADYLERYAADEDLPIVEHAEVRHVGRDGACFDVDSEAGRWSARHVVVATGACDVGALPAVSAAVPLRIAQLHSSRYRAPDALPHGGVLVVGAGPSGRQIALELVRAGRDVVLAAGRHDRLPERHRGRATAAWLDELGEADQLTGLDLTDLHAAGVTVTGRLTGFGGSRASFDAAGLRDELDAADARMRQLLARIDEHAVRVRVHGTADRAPRPVVLPRGADSLDLVAAGIGTVVWATGYRRLYQWLRVPVLDRGEIVHHHGSTPVRGLHVLGLRSAQRRSSHAIAGAGADARALAAQLVATPVLQEAA